MSKGREAILALADGRIFRGRAFGAVGESVGEAVFNTAMTGYQEVLTDPSYRGQLVCMTYPEIGNVGINAEDAESRRVYVEGFIVKELSPSVARIHFDEAWYAYAKFHKIYKHRFAMGVPEEMPDRPAIFATLSAT